MGKVKQLLEFGGRPLLQHVLEPLRHSMVEDIVLVLGKDYREIKEKFDLKDIKVIENKSFKKGMSTSLKVGVRALDKDCDAFLVFLADQPFLKAALVNDIINAYNKGRGLIVVPKHGGRRGNPVLFDFSLASKLLSITGDRGARGVVREEKRNVYELEVDDPSVFFDIDTPKDLQEAASMLP